MEKKLVAIVMAISALAAIAVPSLASAAPVLTQPTGTVVPAGTSLVGTNVGEGTMTTSLGNITCSTVTAKGTVFSNSTASGVKGEVKEVTFGGTGAGGECTTWSGGMTVTANPVTNGLPWCLEATTATDEGKIRGGGCASATRPIRFSLDFTSAFIGTCVYQRSTAAIGTFGTDVSGQEATATTSGQEWTKFEGGAGCPSSGKLDVTFKLETGAGLPTYASS